MVKTAIHETTRYVVQRHDACDALTAREVVVEVRSAEGTLAYRAHFDVLPSGVVAGHASHESLYGGCDPYDDDIDEWRDKAEHLASKERWPSVWEQFVEHLPYDEAVSVFWMAALHANAMPSDIASSWGVPGDVAQRLLAAEPVVRASD